MPIDRNDWTKFLAAVEGVAGLDMRRAWFDHLRGVEVAGNVVRMSAPNPWWAHWMRTQLNAQSLAAAKRVWPSVTRVAFRWHGTDSPTVPSRAPSLLGDGQLSERTRAMTGDHS